MSNLARTPVKLCQNAFQTIPDVSLFDVRIFFWRNFWIGNFVFDRFGVVFDDEDIFFEFP